MKKIKVNIFARINTYVRLVNATDDVPRTKMYVIFCKAVINISLEVTSPLGCNFQLFSVIRIVSVIFVVVWNDSGWKSERRIVNFR